MRQTGNGDPVSAPGSGIKFGPLTGPRLLFSGAFLLICLAGLVLTLGNTHAAGVTWDINNGAYTNDSNCTTLHQCNSITAALAAASPYDTLNVAAGSSVYFGFTVTTPDLTILGPNANNNPITGSRTSEAQIITAVTIQPSATGVTLQGFEFSRPESSVSLKASNTTLKNNYFSALFSTAISVTGPISNLAIEANSVPVVYTAISVKQVSSGHVSGNRLGSTTSTYLDNGMVLDAVINFQVAENIITQVSNQAIWLVNTSGPSSNVTISDNYISRANNNAVADQGAIQVYGDNAGSPNLLTITNNIFQTDRNGVTITTGGQLNGNTRFSNNCFSNTVASFGDFYNGTSASLSAPNNYSSDLAPTVAGPGPVVVTPYLPANGITAAVNPTIQAGSAGQSVVVGQVKNSAGGKVANQIVSYHFVNGAGTNAADGLLTSDGDGILTLNLAQTVPIGSYDLVLNPTSGSLAFPINRQGCQSQIALTLKATPPCTVNSDGGAGYSNIESALASTCSTIRVLGGGPYRTALVIDHPVTLDGPNADINPNTPQTQPRNLEVTLLLTDGFADPTDVLNRGILVRLTSGNVTLNGFTLDGNNPNTTSGVLVNGEDVDASYGVINRSASGSPQALSGLDIKNNIFKNFNLGAVRLDGISGAVSGNYIRYNRIDNVFPAGDDGYGVRLGDNFYAEVAANNFTRVRQGIGITGFNLANPGTPASVHDNSIDSAVAGIRYDSSSGFTIASNTLQSTLPASLNTGLWLTNLSASPALTLSNNTISGGAAGIKAWGVAGVTTSGGSVTGSNYGVYFYNYRPGASPETPDFASFLTLNGLTITGTTTAGVYLADNTANPSNDLTLSLQGGSQLVNGVTGIIVAGQDITLQLHDTAFSGQSGDYLTLQESGGDGTPARNVDARSATFEGVAGASLSGPQYAAVQAKLTDRNDTAVLGLVLLYNPALALSPPTLGFTDKVGGSNPISQSLTISNAAVSAAALDWNVAAPTYTAGSGWLDCTPTGGSLAAGQSDLAVCQPTTGSLANGIYTATLHITSTTPGVQNGSQTVTVTFTVVGLPVITTDPASQSVQGGQPVSLSVGATSLAALSYQWYEGTPAGGGSPVGTDSPQFTSPALTTPTSYWVKVTNLAGSVNSGVADITICGDFEVTSLTDSGAGSLCGTFSHALKKASLSTQPVTITFSPGITSVTLTGPLDPLTNPNQVAITLDGGCNQQGLPQVRLLAGSGSGPTVLSLTGHTTVQCLIVTGFSGFAVSMQGDGNRLLSNWIGTADSTTASGSGGGGVIINGSNNSLGHAGVSSSGNRIFGNNGSGVEVVGGSNNTAYYNHIQVSGSVSAGARAVKVSGGGQLKFGPGNLVRAGSAG